jgi:undecaprenyl-diphosphatase
MSDYWLAVILGIVEGLTEFLPISSTGHLLIAQQLLRVPLDEDPFWKMFTVVIQLPAIFAVVVYYFPRLRTLIADFFAKKSIYPVPRWRHPVILVLAAVAPAGIVGILAKKKIDELMEHALPIGVAFLVGGVLIEVIERWCRGRGWVHDAADVSPGQGMAIGVAQAVALIPGASRSACTIMGGRLLGLDMRAAADFSFLLSIPTMFAAAGYSLYKHRVPLDSHQMMTLGIGSVVSFIVALAVVAWFLHYLKSHSFRLFVIYRVVVGTIVIVAALYGWLG